MYVKDGVCMYIALKGTTGFLIILITSCVLKLECIVFSLRRGSLAEHMTASMFGFGRLSAEGKVGIASGVVFFSMLISRTLISEQVDKNTRLLLFRVQFILFINSLLLLGSLYIWKRVVRRLCGTRAPPTFPQRCWRLVVLLFLILVHGSYFSMFFLVDREPHWFSLLSFSCLGIYVILLFFLVVFGCLNRVRRLFSHSQASEDVVASGPTSQTVLALIITAILAVYGLVNAAQPPRVVEVEIPMEKLPEPLSGLKLVLLSDIHLGPTIGYSKLQQIITMVNELDPGDYITALSFHCNKC